MWPDCSPPSAASCFLHLFEHVAIADRRAQHANAAALERGLQAHVRHGGGDDHVAGQHAASLQIARGHQQNGVAVDDVAVCAGQHAAVGIAVEGEAEVGSARFHLSRAQTRDAARRSWR